eukprot:TRINITY_DN100775_c0_g1_i1.p2 TRINITY_DN100775_c0_g1~~TRINITY_DN100775_c0_g1_i1.p2  ORF type:complete len:242 (-),score=60.70 TRINITY_DN100775_c0_g1_i1:315-986(-)
MPSFKLTYFPITGLGEPVRATFALAGIPFEDVHVTGESWKALKEAEPAKYGAHQLPLLEMDGQLMPQSRALLRYIGSIGSFEGKKLYPEDPLARYYCDEVIEMIEDIRPAIVPTFAIADQAEKEAARAALMAPGGKMYQGFEKLDERLGKFKFAAGDSPSIADIYVVTVSYLMQAPTFIDGFGPETLAPFKNLVALKDKVMSLAPLAEYYKNAEGVRAPFKVA